MCGYLGESFGWHYGFGLAGFGMLAGIIVFWDGMKKGIFGDKGSMANKRTRTIMKDEISTYHSRIPPFLGYPPSF